MRFAVVGCVNDLERILVRRDLIKPGGSKVRTRKPSLNENHQLVENSSLFLRNRFVFPRPVPCARRELSRKLRKARLASNYADTGKQADAIRQVQTAVALRPTDSNILYNAACTYGVLKMKPEALEMLQRSAESGYGNFEWAARDPDLTILYDDPSFQKLIKSRA